MKVLIGQPKHENGITQLDYETKANPDIDIVLYPEGYLTSEKEVLNARMLAKENHTIIITSYRKENKDRAVIISNQGDIILDRAKTPPAEIEELYTPLTVNFYNMKIGYLLCMEILKGVRDLKRVNTNINFIAHPIGVGMYSEEQFDKWIGEAINIARTYKTTIIGTSHADGSYKNCGVSLPISYCICCDGKPIYLSKSDIRTRIVNLTNNKWNLLDTYAIKSVPDT